MGITLICPNLNCGRTIVVQETARGQVVRCAHCSQLFLVPIKNTPDVPAPAPEAAEASGKGSRGGR